VADACAGLHAAHELTDDDNRLLNVVHRDVSPHNILVSLEGTVKMTDFGVAKALGQSHQATVAGQVKGKVAYMAPEQIGGNNFDRRADVFAMGCVLYEAVTGVQAFRGGNDPQVMQAVLRGTFDPPSSIVKGFPNEVAAIIDRALAPEPRARFATAERMRVAIEEWLAKSGSIVTSTQTGSLVRQRLGASLERRREHVKAAMAALQPDAPTTRDIGHTPSQPQPGQSHSGVVSTGTGQPTIPNAPPVRSRAPSLPQVPAPPSPPPPLPPPLPARAGSAAAAPSDARYVIAAIAGVVFALVVGGICVAVWMSMRARTSDSVAGPAVTARASAAVAVAPSPTNPPAVVPTATVTTAPAAATPAPGTSALAAPVAASASPATIDVTDLPTAKPTWQAGAAGPVAAPARPATTATSPALPANPY
jgi:serine/threonine-protein kinase